MFKDYYLILGVSKDATAEEIEKAFKDAEARSGGTASQSYQDAREAFAILSQEGVRTLYDHELDVFNASGDYENYQIKNAELAKTIGSLQTNMAASNDSSSSGFASKLGKGCLWAIVIVILFIFQTCVSAIMKQQGRNAARNGYSYVVPQK